MQSAPVAALWKRLFATCYDILILAAVSLLYGAAVTLASTLVFGHAANEFKPNTNSFFVQAGWLLSLIGFYCYFWTRVGQTVAMKAWNLKVITENGERLDTLACLNRCVLGTLSFCLFGLGYLWAIFDSERLTLHDRLSKTRVIQLPKA